jgi:hypothetical protein
MIRASPPRAAWTHTRLCGLLTRVLKRNASGWHAAVLWVSLFALATALSLQKIYSFDYW